jgi:hypothetical protein
MRRSGDEDGLMAAAAGGAGELEAHPARAGIRQAAHGIQELVRRSAGDQYAHETP